MVTGSTAGIGLAAVIGLFREGASVVVNGRTQGRVEEAVEKIRCQVGDGEVTGIAADLSTAEGKGHPVAFWIHGGGWQAGKKADVQAKPQAFVHKGFVFVSAVRSSGSNSYDRNSNGNPRRSRKRTALVFMA